MNLTVEFKNKLLTILPDRKPVMIYIYIHSKYLNWMYLIFLPILEMSKKITHSETNEKVFRLYTTYIVSSNELA